MKQPLSVRIDSDLLAAARDCARQDNRTLTNFIETALIARIAAMRANRVESASGPSSQDRKGMNRGD
ncbi:MULTISPECIES: hypothetical protein [Methylobacteriaceae]|uniref:hypothetical protein n=1 Tax=Methylobacteriaceae TaxID=119045 RepID=UPI00116E3B9A|nr:MULTISPECIES: hypothetical protein [Methylobacteriaceae]GEL42835.1 hypothetical protein MEX01_34260 [Methylorubrum extorquens]